MRMKTISLFVLAFLLVATLTAFSGAMHGHLKGRWGLANQTQVAAEQLRPLPDQFGDWELQSHVPLGETAINMLECSGWVASVYANRRTGDTVEFSVVLGPVGTIAAHTPEACVTSTHYTRLETRQAVEIVQPAEFGADGLARSDGYWAVDFRSTRPDRRLLRFYYAWSTGGAWMASEQPRWRLVGTPYLYKIQVVSVLPHGSHTGRSETFAARQGPSDRPPDAAYAFLQDAAPLLRSHLVTPEPSTPW